MSATVSAFRHFDPLAYMQADLYTGANAVLAAGCLAALLFVYLRKRHLFLRPSMLLAGFFHVFLQWPVALYAGFYESWLPHPWHFSLAVHGSVIFCLAFGLALPDGRIRACWACIDPDKTRNDTRGDERIVNVGLVALGALAAATLGYYFMYVPLRCTGLYAYIAYPEAGLLLREMSLKLLSARAAAYAYTFYSSFISGLLFLLLVSKTRMRLAARDFAQACFFSALAVLVVLTGSLEGALFRYITYGILLVLFLLWSDRLWFSRRNLLVVAGLCAALGFLCVSIVMANSPSLTPERKNEIVAIGRDCASAIPTLPAASNETWLRNQIGFAPPAADGIAAHALEGAHLLKRIFIVPSMIGGWYAHYMQTHGAFGAAGIARLAKILGTPPAPIGNIIGRQYGPVYYGHAVSASINASTGFLFIYYACFGLAGIFVAWALIAALDLLIFVMRFLSPVLLPAYMAFMTLLCLNLTQSDYGYTLFSGGLLPATGVMAGLQIAANTLKRLKNNNSL